jgi:two-component system response regulator RegX3
VTASQALRDLHYDVTVAGDRAAALADMRAGRYDVVVLERVLGAGDGLDVCRELRATSDVLILMLSVLDGEADRIAGLEAGADGYVPKPVAVSELVSRIRSLLRRRELDRAACGVVREVGTLRLDLARATALVNGAAVRLTRAELRLVELLASDPGRVFTRAELVQRLRGDSVNTDAGSIDVHVSNLRRTLEAEPRRPQRLLTVRGVGYRLLPG